MQYYSFASTYGTGSYNTTFYSGSATGTGGAGGASGGQDNGQLTDTGIGLTLIITLACALMFVALLIKIWKRPTKKLVETTNTD